MRKMFGWIGVLVIGVFLTGCSPSRYIYKEISQDKSSYNTQTYEVAAADLNKAVTQMLLAKKFEITEKNEDAGTITATRVFSKSYQTTMVKVQASVVTNSEKNQSLYLNGVQSTERHYVQDHTRTLLWVVPIPGGGGKSVSTSKEADVTIDDAEFYKDLFDGVRKNLPSEGSKR